jgi:hypothetical protein
MEHLIGSRHHTSSEGTYCETLLKEFLRRTLPKHVSVDGGFIRRVSDADWTVGAKSPLAADAPIATPQLDIIVHDTQNYAPLFRSEDLVVVLPEAVRAVIEVKKSLTWNRLEEAVTNITDTTHLLRKWRYEPHSVFTGIFAFGLGDDLKPKKKPISEAFKGIYQTALNRHRGDCDLPHLAMALPRFALQSNPPEQYDYCPTAPEGAESPNIAGQFLVFLLTYFTSWGQGRALPYPEALRGRRKKAFKIRQPKGKKSRP